jgi:hypothetical protein
MTDGASPFNREYFVHLPLFGQKDLEGFLTQAVKSEGSGH